MPEKLTQQGRFARLTTPLGEDVLVLLKLEGTEAISENFEWRVGCLLNADELPVDPKDIIGKPCNVDVDSEDGEARHFHGLCTEIRFRGWRSEYMYYQLTLRPWTWLLTRETRSRVFHELRVSEIIQMVLSEAGFTEFESRLQKNYDPIHFCVQYQETNYAFVSRLMEKYGIFFYFKFTAQQHVLVLVDSQTALPDIDGYGSLRFQPHTDTGIREDRIIDWQAENRLRTAIYDVDDYNYERPNTALEKTGNAKDSPGHGHNRLRKYKYPAGHSEPGVGQLLADILVDAERADAARKFAFGYAPKIHAGGVFSLAEHPADEENGRHFAVAAQHSIFVQHFRSVADYEAPYGSPEAKEQEEEPQVDQYVGEYEVAEGAKAYKAPLKTPWPRIWGAQTALVIKSKNAPADEEIDVDDQGRILVQFHWNDIGGVAQASCRVRVAQIWAGNQWGGVWIPRVGMEAVVEFLEGDPDRPLVTGTVYNGNNKPPINFPGDKTKSTIKSQSSKGGTAADHFNELRFEDKKDDEEIYIHAERDRLMVIEHDDDITIGNNQTEKIGGSRTFELTGGDETITLKGAPGTKDKYGSVITKNGHRTTTLEMGDETLTVQKGKRTTTIKMDDKRTVNTGNDITIIETGNQTNTVKTGNQTNTVETGNQTNTVSKGNHTTDIKMGNQTIKLGMGNQTTTLDMGNQSTTLKLGNQTTKMNVGKGTVQAMQGYEIKVGGSSIKITPMSIELKAMMIKINATMMLEAKGGLMAKVQGGAMLTLKGGIVMIN